MIEKIILEIVLINYLGIRVIINATTDNKDTKKTVFMGLSVILSVALAAAINLLLRNFYPISLKYIAIPMIAVFSATITSIVFTITKENAAILYYNTAISGIILLTEKYKSDLLESLIMPLVASIGFFLVLMITHTIYKKLDKKSIPEVFRGEPTVLFILGLLSLIISGVSKW